MAIAKESDRHWLWNQNVFALVSLNLDGYLFDSCPKDKALEVKVRLAADFRGWESDNAIFEREFEKLVMALRADDGGRARPPVSKLKS